MAMSSTSPEAERPSRYDSQKRRDWQTFTRYLAAHRPPLVLRRCSGAHVLEFLRYLDRFGKTRVHAPPCPAYGDPAAGQPAACHCPLRQAWGSLDALVGRLRAAFDERHGRGAGAGGDHLDQPQQHGDGEAGANPFAARAVRLYLRDVRDAQARARGISYHKKNKRKAAPSTSKNGGGSDAAVRARGHESTRTAPAAAAPALHPPPPPCLSGVPFECCDIGTAIGGGATAGCYGGLFQLPFNASI